MDEIKCKFIFKDDYNPKYVNGAHGGINSLGEIVVNFYFERSALPVSQTYMFKDGNLGSEEVGSEPEDLKRSFVRVIENGVIMNYQTAKEIHNWLGNHLETLEKISTKK